MRMTHSGTAAKKDKLLGNKWTFTKWGVFDWSVYIRISYENLVGRWKYMAWDVGNIWQGISLKLVKSHGRQLRRHTSQNVRLILFQSAADRFTAQTETAKCYFTEKSCLEHIRNTHTFKTLCLIWCQCLAILHNQMPCNNYYYSHRHSWFFSIVESFTGVTMM